jgi:hypothetical protein
VIGETPGADGLARPVREDAADRERPDLGEATGLEFDDRGFLVLAVLRGGGDVVGGDWTAHGLPSTPIR